MLGLRGVEDVDAGTHEISFDGGLRCHWRVDDTRKMKLLPRALE